MSDPADQNKPANGSRDDEDAQSDPASNEHQEGMETGPVLPDDEAEWAHRLWES